MSKSKNNYNKMYNSEAGKRAETKPLDEAIPAEVNDEVVEAVEAEPTPAPVKMEEKASTGKVTCELLNVREAPNTDADVVEVITKDSEVTINLKESTDEWYKVLTSNKFTGYCMKKFIAVL